MKSIKLALIALIGVLAMSLSGCMRPVEPKVLITANPNETMFVVPLVGENKSNQDKLNSEEYYNQNKVAVREFMVPHRWLNRGRWEWMQDGNWIPTVMVIKVNRTPVTCEYDVKPTTGEPIWLESSDSVGFSTGFSVSAMIEESDAAKFLYRYQAKDLKDIINTEVRARIQATAFDFCARERIDSLRNMKSQMLDSIKADVVPFFKERGITITTLGQFGGFTYENPEIQKAIDNVFVAQQEKEKAAAQLAAVGDINHRSEALSKQEGENAKLKAQGDAEAIRLTAQAQADAVRMKAEADAKGIQAVNNATKEAQSNPLFLAIRQLEVEIVKYNRWGGTVPTTLIEGNGQSGLNLFLTPPNDVMKSAAVSK